MPFICRSGGADKLLLANLKHKLSTSILSRRSAPWVDFSLLQQNLSLYVKPRHNVGMSVVYVGFAVSMLATLVTKPFEHAEPPRRHGHQRMLAVAVIGVALRREGPPLRKKYLPKAVLFKDISLPDTSAFSPKYFVFRSDCIVATVSGPKRYRSLERSDVLIPSQGSRASNACR